MNDQKCGLALHTSTGQLGLGLIDSSQVVKVEVWDLDRAMLNHLHQYLKDFLKGQNWQDLAFIAVAKGPGSFTSIRIGMVTARTLAQQLSIPLLAISTLATLAQNKADQLTIGNTLIATQLVASNGKYYVAIYEKLPNKEAVSPIFLDTIMALEDWQKILSELEKPYLLVEGETKLGYTVESLLKLAYNLWSTGYSPQWFQGVPFYLDSY